jgi:hypothetical protein
MKKIFLHILVIALICYSCNDRNLGDGYYFLPKYEAIDVGYANSEAIVYSSNQEYSFDDIKISGDVLEVASNSKFIIAKRDPLVSMDINSGEIEYYIIDKKIDKVFGPLTKDDFIIMIELLGIKLEFD